MNKINLIIIVVALSMISGCGYRLAGKADLDPVFENTSVTYKGDGRVVAELLEKQFEVNKIKLVNEGQASARVVVLYDHRDREVLSVDEEGKVREYELILRVGVDVSDAEGKKLIKPLDIRLTRDFLFEVDEVLGKASEEHLIYQEMREDIARLVMYRLQAISTQEEET